MASRDLEDIIRRAEQLTPEEQLLLIAHLADKAESPYRVTKPRRKWSEICGAAPYPFVGEDAQQWVSRARSESRFAVD